MEKRRHECQTFPCAALDAVNVSFVNPREIQSVGERSYLWDLSCSGGCVCTGGRLTLDVGQHVILRLHDYVYANEYLFDAIVRWVDQARFGFEFSREKAPAWINGFLLATCC